MSDITKIVWNDLLTTIAAAEQIFDTVRLVDPIQMCVVEIEEGNIVKKEQACYSIWNYESRCTNCSGLCAYNQECSISKMERIGQKSYHVLSNVICITDKNGTEHTLTMELVSETMRQDEQARGTILVVDDQEVNRLIIHKILEEHFRVIEAGDGKEALDILEKEYQDVSAIVLDLVMPGFDGYTTLRFIQNDSRYSKIPVLVTTGNVDWKTEKKCLEAGAWDFIPKPINKDTLKLRLKNIIGRSQFDYQKYEQYIAEHDRLTGLFNRTKFLDEIRDRQNQQSENGTKQAFLRIDLNRFHLYNSFFGEKEGDRLLIYFGGIIKEAAKLFDHALVGRIESDIFAIFGDYEKGKISELEKFISEELKDYNDAYYIEANIGVYVMEETESAAELMYEKATMAAEASKHTFKKNVGYYDENMTNRLIAEQEVMSEADTALKEEQFVLYLQPKANIRSEEFEGAEVLVRWNHKEKGILSPGKFIPFFESNGFIGKLDYYIWEHTCIILKKWIDEGLEPMPVSVNVSQANMFRPNLVEIFNDLLEKYQVPRNLFQIELSENIFIDDREMMIEKITEIRENGYTVLMDNFGSVFSSLNMLKEIPVDILKVDMKFLGNSVRDGKNERILASIVRMAAWLDVQVIVEGVEDVRQKNFLESIGCEYAQGYYYARPMPWQEYENLLHEKGKIPKKAHGDSKTSDVVSDLWKTNPEMERAFFAMTQPAAIFAYELESTEITLLQGNGEFGGLFGFEETKGDYIKGMSKFIPDNYVTGIRSAFGSCATTQKITSCDYMRLDEAGNNLWYRVRIQYIGEENDKVFVMTCFFDITQEKALEQEVRRYKLYAKRKKKRAKMLVVDDSGISRLAVKELFKERFEILEAGNGIEALNQLEKHYQDTAIILLDMMMPEMNGKEFLKIKNSSEKYEDIPVIVISADYRQEEQVDMLKNGVNDYVTKPFIPEVVERRVLNVIEYNSRFRKLLKEYQKSTVVGEKKGNWE